MKEAQKPNSLRTSGPSRHADSLLLALLLLKIFGEGNGTPLQYSCLENPMDGGVW